jgi:uncharacterized protein YcgL (UPF0745 family)
MYKARVVITIERDKEFTNEEVREIMKDIQARLQGYYTKTPEPMKNAKMNIGYEKVN